MNTRSIRFLLGAIAVLLAANLLVQINRPARTAQAAGLPDSGAQLQAVVDQLTELNKRVDKMQSYLESGKMTVQAKVDKDAK
jgi:hypothetical protein